MSSPSTAGGDGANRAAWIASLCAAAMIAAQVGSKSVRDALFLSAFEVRWLPPMVIGGALLSLATVPVLAAITVRWSPQRVVPALYMATSGLVLAVWGLQHVNAAVSAVLFFLLVASAGALLISGFWSVANERFEPRTGKRYFARIGGAATAGGLIGGVLVERMAALGAGEFVLPVLAVLFLVCGLLVRRVGDASIRHEEQEKADSPGTIRLLRERPYLRNLALLVVLLAASAGVIDYVFKAEAAEAYDRQGLMRFFAAFYTGVGLLTFAVQSLLTGPLLRRLGLGRAVSTLPGAVLFGSLLGAIVPGIGSAAAARASEDAVRNSTFRSGYELLYVPVAKSEKRRIKTVVDVAFDRIGSTAGSLLVSGLLLAQLAVPRVLFGLAIGLAVLAWVVTRRLERGYTDALERSLVDQADALDIDTLALTDGVEDGAMRSLLHQTLGGIALDPRDPHASQTMSQRLLSGARLDLAASRPVIGSPAAPKRTGAAAKPPKADPPSPRRAHTSAPPTVARAFRPVASTPLVVLVEDLRSGDLERVEAALAQVNTTELVGHVIPLLAWDRASNAALDVLGRMAPRCTGQLIDALLEPKTPFASRRRLPRALAYAANDRAVAGLLRALHDERFEVRYHAGRALLRLCREHEHDLDEDTVFAIIERETEVEHGVWSGLRLLDEGVYRDTGDGAEIDADTPGLAHVFNLLSLILPREPLRIAYRGLHTDDPRLRGTALEYLERVLPTRVQEALRRVVQAEQREQLRSTNGSDALEALMRSRESISQNLRAVRASRKQRDEPA